VFDIPRETLLAEDAPVAVLSEVERLRLVEVQLGDLAKEIRRARKQLTDQDAALNRRLAALGSAIERLSARRGRPSVPYRIKAWVRIDSRQWIAVL
jgi:hypothetical protein